MADTRVVPAQDTADPTLRFTQTIRYQYRYQVPLRVHGQVRSQSGKVLGDLIQIAVSDNAGDYGILGRSAQNEPMQDRVVVLDCRLSDRAIAQLTEERDRNPKKDVQLTLSLMVNYLLPRFRVTGAVPGTNVTDVVNADNTNWGPGIGELKSEMLTASVVIYASQWVSDFAPAFGIGRFLVVEVPEVQPPRSGGGAFAARIEHALSSVEEMRADIEAGHWTECVEHSRSVAELLKDPEEVKSILAADGLSDAAADDIVRTLRGSFDFASKFLKKLERGGAGMNPVLVAKKEDALFVYSSAVSLVNLLSRKASRQSE